MVLKALLSYRVVLALLFCIPQGCDFRGQRVRLNSSTGRLWVKALICIILTYISHIISKY